MQFHFLILNSLKIWNSTFKLYFIHIILFQNKAHKNGILLATLEAARAAENVGDEASVSEMSGRRPGASALRNKDAKLKGKAAPEGRSGTTPTRYARTNRMAKDVGVEGLRPSHDGPAGPFQT